jgi:fructan beta-fructosidase
MTRDEPHRPQYHFSARKNWINDPNGLVWLDGEYHLFFQYNPHGDQWGHMSWGHAVSTDLLHWQELPVAIPEDERVSIFSGSVVMDSRNSSGFGSGDTAPLVAVYTGCLRRPEGGQAQELAYSTDRGRSWTKYAGNPVLDLGLRDFRDPKVFWHEPSACWVMMVVVPDDRLAKFYASHDLKAWAWLSDFSAPFEGEGIWECPDLIPLADPAGGTAWLFKVDVFGGHPSGGTGARLFLGRFDGTHFVAEPEPAPRWADFGADFYAALSWANLPAAQPRPVWLAWMNCHRYAKLQPTSPWRGAMSVPRTLALQRPAGGGWQLLQQPLDGVQGLWRQLAQPADVELMDRSAELLPPAADGRCADIELTLETSGASECGLLVHAGGAEGTRIGYDAARGTVFVDRSASGWLAEGDVLYPQRRQVPVPPPAPGRPLRLRVLVDRCSVEVFVGDGEAVLTELVFPSPASRGLRLYAAGGRARFGQLRVRTGLQNR